MFSVIDGQEIYGGRSEVAHTIVTAFSVYIEHYIRGIRGFDLVKYKCCNWEWKMEVLHTIQNNTIQNNTFGHIMNRPGTHSPT